MLERDRFLPAVTGINKNRFHPCTIRENSDSES